MSQGSLELHVLSHVVLGPLSDVTHLTHLQPLCVLHNVSSKDAPLTAAKLFSDRQETSQTLPFFWLGVVDFTSKILQLEAF